MVREMTPQKPRINDQRNKIHTASVDSRRSTQCGSSDRIFKIRKSERGIKGYSAIVGEKHNGHESDEWS